MKRILLLLLLSGCAAPPPPEPAPQLRLTGSRLSNVLRQLGDPDEVAEGRYFGIKFSDGPIAAVLKYHRTGLYVYLNETGIVLGVAEGSTKTLTGW